MILDLRRFATALTMCTVMLGCSSGGSGGTQDNANALNLPAANFGPNTIAVQRAFPALTFASPVLILQAPGIADRWYVLEKAGVVRTFTANATQADIFVDLRDRVDANAPEGGLLGMSFHPQFAQNHLVYVSYTGAAQTAGAAMTSYIARLTANADGLSADPTSAQIVLAVDQPETNHKGGEIGFGPDGLFYIGFGDGGVNSSANAQNTQNLLGKILRIDVDSATPYAVPSDNPFAGNSAGGRPEIYAWGLRNPWRWSFDRARSTPMMWIGDVGETMWEEIDILKAGANYGWPVREGKHCLDGTATCASTGMTDPIFEYAHDAAGGIAIIGGTVYRGSAIPALYGAYIYGDFGNGRIWALGADASGQPQAQLLVQSGLSIASFGQDNAGELYIVDYHGTIHKIIRGSG